MAEVYMGYMGEGAYKLQLSDGNRKTIVVNTPYNESNYGVEVNFLYYGTTLRDTESQFNNFYCSSVSTVIPKNTLVTIVGYIRLNTVVSYYIVVYNGVRYYVNTYDIGFVNPEVVDVSNDWNMFYNYAIREYPTNPYRAAYESVKGNNEVIVAYTKMKFIESYLDKDAKEYDEKFCIMRTDDGKFVPTNSVENTVGAVTFNSLSSAQKCIDLMSCGELQLLF